MVTAPRGSLELELAGELGAAAGELGAGELELAAIELELAGELGALVLELAGEDRGRVVDEDRGRVVDERGALVLEAATGLVRELVGLEMARRAQEAEREAADRAGFLVGIRDHQDNLVLGVPGRGSDRVAADVRGKRRLVGLLGCHRHVSYSDPSSAPARALNART